MMQLSEIQHLSPIISTANISIQDLKDTQIDREKDSFEHVFFSDFNLEMPMIENPQTPLYSFDLEDSFFMNIQPILENSTQKPEPPKPVRLQRSKVSRKPKVEENNKKNSNTIKKYGRLILDNLEDYKINGHTNQGIDKMVKHLTKMSKVGRKEVNKRDKFNTYHLKTMLDVQNQDVLTHNLKITQKILSLHLRKNVLESRQIDQDSKITYMNTMKCCSLRLMNSKLAVRLQISPE